MASIKLVSETTEQTIADVVFIHGLWGDAEATWEWIDPQYGDDEKSFWPKDLANELPNVAVWTVGYDSSPTKWVGHNMPLLDRANSLLDLLDANGIGSRPLIFVVHSLGGLLAKAIVRASHGMPVDEDKHSLHRNARGIIFFSTPHTGSSVANLAASFPGSRPTEILKELARNDAYLRDLSQWFSDISKPLGIKCITYFESYKTKNLTVVDAVSAHPNCGARPVPFDGDHFSVCKIRDTSDQRYKQVLKFVQRVVASLSVPTEKHAETTQVDGVDFEIGVFPNPPQDGRVVEHHPIHRTLAYTSRSSTDHIRIAPRMGYLDDLANGVLINPLAYFWNPFRCQFPSLDVMLVNNSTRTLMLSEAVLEVASSRPDFSPVLIVPSNTWNMKLKIRNEGWGKISNAVLRCNLLPTSANGYMPDPPIDHIEVGSVFSHEFRIGDFAESAEVDLRSTIRKLGVDIDAIEAAPKRNVFQFAHYAMQNNLDTTYAKHMARFPEMETDSAWAPFPDGYVVVAGRIDFDSLDQNGAEVHLSLPVRARVFMFNERFDQPRPPSYQYSAELEHTGENYEVPVKISQSLSAGEADRFTIRIACSQSAFHSFRIRWKFVGGLSCLSFGIQLQHFVPRTFSCEESQRVEDSKFDPELYETKTVFTGDCVEQSILMAMNVAQMRANAERRPS